MKTLRIIAHATVIVSSMCVADVKAADLTNFNWPWSQPNLYSDTPTYDWSGGYIAIMAGYNSSNITKAISPQLWSTVQSRFRNGVKKPRTSRKRLQWT